jgi:NCS1 family nucleobase:cation symporter-1
MISANGLSWWQSWICVWLGYTIAACFICLTGRIGATYHISFPVVTRASFGIWGALWPVFNRAAMACIWYGVQAWIGGTCVQLMISAIWPSFTNLPNGIPSSGTNTRDFVSFFIFWLCSLPAIWFPVHQIRHLFTVKAYVVPVAGIAFFIWAIVRAKGIGPIVKQPATAHGSSALGWGMVQGIMSAIANFATLIVVCQLPTALDRLPLTLLLHRMTPTSLVLRASRRTPYGLNCSPSLLDSRSPRSSV